jgi:hypothetical protein
MGRSLKETYSSVDALPVDMVAYIAGLIDADGTLTLTGPKQRANGVAAMPNPMLLVVNSDLELIRWLKVTIGFGCVYETKTKPTRPDQSADNWNKVHRFQMTGGGAVKLIARVRPYLRVKAAQADLLLKVPRRGQDCAASASNSQRDAAQQILASVRALNQRGVKPCVMSGALN